MVVALGVLAIALGGALFPATGFGSAPASETDLVGPDRSGPGEGGTGVSTAAGPTVTDTGTRTGPSKATQASTTGDSGATATPSDSGQTATPTLTATATATPTPTPEPDDEDGGPFGAVFGFITFAVFAAVVLVAIVRSNRTRDGRGGPALNLGGLGVLGRVGRLSPSELASSIPQATMVTLVGLSTGTTRVLSSAGSVASQAAGGLAVAMKAGSRGATKGLFAGLDGLFSMPSAPTFSLSGIFAGFGGGGTSTAGGRSPGTDARAATSVEPESSADPIRTVDDAWETFTDPLPAANPEARTPGEFARLATEYGDPEPPVRQLTRVFRDVRYGGFPGTAERTRSALRAVRAILAERTEEDDE